jgi:magnesium transporter
MRTFRTLPSPLRSRVGEPDIQPIHVPIARAMVDCGVYADGERLPGKYVPADALRKVRELERAGKEAFAWVGLYEPDERQMETVADVFGLHELAVEDAVHAHQRPKLERYNKTLFMVLKTVNYVEHESVAKAREIVETGEIMVFVGVDFVVTVRHGDHSGLAAVRQRIDASPAMMKLGPYAIMHAIADHVVDTYLEVTDLVETDIDAMEVDVFSPGTHTNIECIYLLKREVVELRRAVSPLTLALQRLGTDHNDLVSIEVMRYMRDVLDHQIQASERITSYDEMLSSLVHAALGKVAMQQNVDMRKISAWVAIAAVPTAIAGVYGMNFEHMPELTWTYGYPAVLALMFGVCMTLYFVFRRYHWL